MEGQTRRVDHPSGIAQRDHHGNFQTERQGLLAKLGEGCRDLLVSPLPRNQRALSYMVMPTPPGFMPGGELRNFPVFRNA